MTGDEAGGCATLTKDPAHVGRRKALRAVVGGAGGFAAAVADRLRRLGWQVVSVPADGELRRAVRGHRPHAVVLPVEPGSESGFLLCAKLRSCCPKARVVLVGERSAEAVRFAAFVGATALVAETDGAGAVVDEVLMV